MQFSSVLLSFLAATPALSSPVDVPAQSPRSLPTLPLPAELIEEFAPGIFLENIAVRRNGQILVTVASAPELYQVDPTKKQFPILIYRFPATFATGIVEVATDVFYVATARTSGPNPFVTVPGSPTIWKVDFRSFSIPKRTPATVSKVASFPKAGLLNGITVLNKRKGLLLLADSTRGLIWQLNIYTKKIEIFADDPLAKQPPNPRIPVGVNGIKVRNRAVYFSNTLRGIIARINIKENQFPVGPAVVVAKGLTGVDDFTIGYNGGFFAALNFQNALGYASSTGTDVKILANITSNPTAVAFGRTPKDKQSVYVTSAGGTLEDFASKNPPAGKLYRVDVSSILKD